MIANRPQLFALAVLLAASCTAEDRNSGGRSVGAGGKADGTSDQLEVVTHTPVAKLVADVACIESFNAENESNGVRLYFKASSYSDARDIMDSGLTTTFLGGGETCVSGGGTLPYAVVGLYDNATTINAAIVGAGGFKEALVVFYNRDALDDAFRANTVHALEDIE
jgi:hypothetical protein